jgi:anti-sigma regulatory factor (Ser/Thr protein kinase)
MEVIPVSSQLVIPVVDITQVGDARRRAIQTADAAGFSEASRGRVAIVASELATNLARYATGGEMQIVSHGGTHGAIDLIAIDRGPGIADVPRCLIDGYSTGGTPGNGLGAARRLSADFDIYSTPPTGTVVFSRLVDEGRNLTDERFRWGVAGRPAPYEVVSGDAWQIRQDRERLSIMMVDGLGHGPEAAAAALEAVAEFESDPFVALPIMFQRCHDRMRGTRGAAIACAQLNAVDAKLLYAGIGNIAGHLRPVPGEHGQGLLSHNGTVGVQIRKSREVTYECPAEGLLIMHSDGLQSRWSVDSYPGLALRHPAVIAAILYRDCTRGRDDVTVAAIRFSMGSTAGQHAA